MNFNKYHNKDISRSSFLITGGAGFIGSHLAEYLSYYNPGKLIILDNLSTGFKKNIDHLVNSRNIEFVEGDITNYTTCNELMKGIDYVLHQAALGSVPRSIDDPIKTNETNISGFLNILNAAKESKVKRLVYAASSSTYGDSKALPKTEDNIGNPLSPYAVTKYVNELYAKVFSDVYGFHSIGLRYFNVFGPKQSAEGAYSAVIPLFITKFLEGEAPQINGDGYTSRDFTYVANVVQANIKALFSSINTHQVFNIACNQQITLRKLVEEIAEILHSDIKAVYKQERQGDVKHSLADISKAKHFLDYKPEILFKTGLEHTIRHFQQRSGSK
ncbi:UDP-N-acetylglucosamine 4-epimerase [Dyadobacter sp. CECT 9275]|uniref:UDP-N-acetylglucosamine 4-epimerase n=1 Tax=Dyadobacter helix TaxID=2822344 RepID=A0A916ND81_9BACT|nr:SDR family oxidoreductase [Dyadobacter sp. CECT 9275]CAG5006520.1 UDP-N-acetylglucosamine 4-epimerase [Dyadobacter sp. CECT 9275]